MSSVIESSSTPVQSRAVPYLSNTVALIGVILTVVAIGLCVLLFFMVNQLPDGIEDFRALESDTPTQIRLLILGCSTAVLSLVAFVLCAVGLFLPNRPRILAALGTAVSACLLLGVFGVLVVGVLMNSPSSNLTTVDPDAPDTSVVEDPVDEESNEDAPAEEDAPGEEKPGETPPVEVEPDADATVEEEPDAGSSVDKETDPNPPVEKK